MDGYISPEVDARFELRKNASKSGSISSEIASSISVIDLVLIAYRRENPSVSSSGTIHPVFKDIAIDQMELFLFSGYGTISSTIR